MWWENKISNIYSKENFVQKYKLKKFLRVKRILKSQYLHFVDIEKSSSIN